MAGHNIYTGIVCMFLLLASCSAHRVRTHSRGWEFNSDSSRALREDTGRFRQSDSCRERLSVRVEEIVLSVPDSAGRQHVRSVRRITAGRQTESGRQTDARKRERREAGASRSEQIQMHEEMVRETDPRYPFPGLRIIGWVSVLMVAFAVWRKFRRSG